jgi:hypothetical protein
VLRLDLERELPCSPARAFPLIAEPALINLWSSAEVESIATGDGDHPGGTGALRKVHTPRRPRTTLLEVIERADAPRRLDYRVIAGAPIRHHAGSIHLLEQPGGTLMRWEVEMDFLAPGMSFVAKRALLPELNKSLDRLVALAAAPPKGQPLPPTRALDDGPEALLALREDAETIAQAQRALADRLLHHGDDRGHFARVYQYVTEDMAAMVDNERFDHPGWVLRLVPIFHRFYEHNLTRRLGERVGAVEPHWERAFTTTERARERGKTAFEAAMLGIFVGMRAHIEDDLPRALAEAYRDYAGRCDYARFRPDYLRMAQIFTEAGDRLLADWPRRAWTPRARFLDRITPRALRDQLLDRTFYPITQQRRRAFERGAELAGTRA